MLLHDNCLSVRIFILLAVQKLVLLGAGRSCELVRTNPCADKSLCGQILVRTNPCADKSLCGQILVRTNPCADKSLCGQILVRTNPCADKSLCGQILVRTNPCADKSLCGQILVRTNPCADKSLCGQILVWYHVIRGLFEQTFVRYANTVKRTAEVPGSKKFLKNSLRRFGNLLGSVPMKYPGARAESQRPWICL